MNILKKVSLIFALSLLVVAAQAQFGRALGNAIENAAKNATIRAAERKTDEAVSKTIDKATDPDTYKSDGNDENESGNTRSSNNRSNNNQSYEENEESNARPSNTNARNSNQPASAQQAPSAAPKLESFTQYDFVPGDQILFFEDFSQDAVGDFPDQWTTNGSGEVRTINIAPGKWLHPTDKNNSYNCLKTINLPENFIVEFDYIPATDPEGGTRNFQFTLYNEVENKELNHELFAGDQGLQLHFGIYGWYVRGYHRESDFVSEGSSEKNPLIDNAVNHVIMWVQKRRVRVYHLGAKVLDLPTVLPANAKFNRLRFFGWDMGELPFISNIKITTAAPDMRSKLLTEGKIISYGINFDSGKDVIKPESYGAIKAIADVLNENPNVRVRVVGHTDSDGNADANLDLSKRRAAAVKDCLSKNFGIDAARIETDGKGQTEPLAPNNTTEGKAKNRRVEFVKI